MRNWVDELKGILSFPQGRGLDIKIFRWDPVFENDIFIENRTLLTEYDSDGYLCVEWEGILRPVRRSDWQRYFYTPFIFKGERVESARGFFVYENAFKEVMI
jgi:hypothetical protein